MGTVRGKLPGDLVQVHQRSASLAQSIEEGDMHVNCYKPMGHKSMEVDDWYNDTYVMAGQLAIILGRCPPTPELLDDETFLILTETGELVIIWHDKVTGIEDV